jgi:hypothetical protein
MMPPPPRLDEIEAYVTASGAPAIVMVDRPLMIELLQYLRWLERGRQHGADDGR